MAGEGKGKKKTNSTKGTRKKAARASSGGSRKSALKPEETMPALDDTQALATEAGLLIDDHPVTAPEAIEASDEEALVSAEERLADFIIFKVADDSYAVRVTNISEILRQQIITKAPRCAEHVVGVTSLRGVIIPVIDPGVILRRKRHFGIKDASKIMVLKSDPLVGMMVSPALNMISTSEEDIKPNPVHLEQWRAELLEGAIELNGEFISVISVENILNIKATGRLNEREA